MFQIAHAYSIPLSELLRANRVPNPNVLRPGQKILIPGARRKRRVEKFAWDKLLKGSSPKGKNHQRTSKYSNKPSTYSSNQKVRFYWPAKGKVLSKYGKRNRKMHNGIDISLDPSGPIRASSDGKVVYKGKGVEGYGNLLILRHPRSLFSVYAYLGDIEAEKGNEVKKGDMIARAGSRKDNSFFHFEIRRGKIALNPLKILRK